MIEIFLFFFKLSKNSIIILARKNNLMVKEEKDKGISVQDATEV